MMRKSWLLALLTLFIALPAQAAFTDNGDGTVTDTVTGLMWDKCSWGQSNNTDCGGGAATTHTWAQALGVAITANSANYKSHADWRLPNINELESLVKIEASSPAIDTTAFPNTEMSSWYWSSTNRASDPANAWSVLFDIGDTYVDSKTYDYYVRLVRSGQPFASFDGLDITPDAFTFTAQTGAALTTAMTSNTLTVAGITTVSPITIVGGSYAINGGAYTAAAGTVNNGDTLTVKLTTSASYSTLTAATLTIGGVTGAFNVTTLAAPAPAPTYDPGPYIPPPPTLITALPSSITTLTGTTPVTAAPGSTLVIPAGASVSGVLITLTAPLADVAANPVTINIGGNSLAVTPTGGNAILTLKIIDLKGVPTLVPTVSSGMVTVSAAPGQPLLVVSNSGVVITAGAQGGAVAFVDDGAANLSVTGGDVVLPANAFAGNPFSAIADSKVLAGETAEFDVAGKVRKVRLGTLAGDTAIAGDKRSRTNSANLEYHVWVPQLDAVPTRYGASPKLSEAIVAQVKKDLPEFVYQGMQADGSLRFSTADGRLISALPVETVEVDTSQPDGITIDAHNKVKVATQGLITRFSSNATDLPALAAGIQAWCPICKTVQLEDGNLRVTNDNVAYVGVADWYVYAQQGADGFDDNLYPYGPASYADKGRNQPFYPTAADLEAILAAAQALDPTATALIQNDGSVVIQVGGKRYTLTPEYTMQVKTPAAHAKDAWWAGENGIVYLKNRDGSVQGFMVK